MYTVISNMIFTHYQSNGITLTHCVLNIHIYMYRYFSPWICLQFTTFNTDVFFFSFEISTLTELAKNCLAGSDWR